MAPKRITGKQRGAPANPAEPSDTVTKPVAKPRTRNPPKPKPNVPSNENLNDTAEVVTPDPAPPRRTRQGKKKGDEYLQASSSTQEAVAPGNASGHPVKEGKRAIAKRVGEEKKQIVDERRAAAEARDAAVVAERRDALIWRVEDAGQESDGYEEIDVNVSSCSDDEDDEGLGSAAAPKVSLPIVQTATKTVEVRGCPHSQLNIDRLIDRACRTRFENMRPS